MGFKQSIEKQLTKFGKNNSPTVVAMSIAAAKGVFRPAFTMMDTKESYETKRYTALREGLTEVIAIPVYYLSGVAAKKVSEKLAVPKNFMSKTIYKKFKKGESSAEIKNAVKHAEEMAKTNLPKIVTTTSFIGVCVSALLVIPFVCSATIKPIMEYLGGKKAEKTTKPEKTADFKEVQKPAGKVNTFKSLYGSNNYGMKVGAL